MKHLLMATLLLSAETPRSNPADPATASVDKGINWLASVQGKNGGWGQDGGETSYIRQSERLETNGNDVANTAESNRRVLHGTAAFLVVQSPRQFWLAQAFHAG